MIELERHIEILLLSNDCVIVPNFGGFMAHHVDARYDDEDGLFLPPQRTLGFNPQLTLNDSLLAQSYIEAYDISYPEALRRIADEVRELKQHIDNQGFYELNDIGTIKLNKEGKYEFSPCEAGILTPDLYGLSSFDMLPLQTTATSPAQADYPYSDSDDEPHGVSLKISSLRYVAAACIVAIVFLLYPSRIGNGSSTNNKNLADTGILYDLLPKAVVQTPTGLQPNAPTLGKQAEEMSLTNSSTTNTAKESSDNKATQAALHPAPEKKEAFYTVVLCSRVTRSNAERYAQELKNKGLQEAESITHNHNTRVVYGRYATESEAYRTMHKLQQDECFSDCWVTKIKES